MTASVAATFLVYEGVRRVAWLRFLFGLRPRRAVAAAPVGEGSNEEVGYPHQESVLR